MNSPEVAQHVKVKRGGLDRLGSAFAKTIQVSLGRGKLGVAQQGLLRQELARFIDIARHEHAERDAKGVRRPLVERLQLFCAFGRKLKPPLDLFGRELAQVLVNNIADVLEVDSEGNNFHRPMAFALIKAAARELCHI